VPSACAAPEPVASLVNSPGSAFTPPLDHQGECRSALELLLGWPASALGGAMPATLLCARFTDTELTLANPGPRRCPPTPA
jgi:hypothetical protein